MENGKAAGGAGPCGVSGLDAFETNEAGKSAGTRGCKERLNFYEILVLRCGIVAGEFEIRFEDSGRKVIVFIGYIAWRGRGIGIGIGRHWRKVEVMGGGGCEGFALRTLCFKDVLSGQK